MKITMPRTPRALRTGSSLLVNRISWATLGVFATAAVLAAQDPGRQAVRYHDCTGWRGTIVARGVADASSFAMVAAALRDKKVALDLDYSLYSEVEFELTTMETEPWVWIGKVTNARYETYYRCAIRPPEGNQLAQFTAAGPLVFDADHKVRLEFHHDDTWSVRAPSGKLSTQLREQVTTKEGRVFKNSLDGNCYGFGSTEHHAFRPAARVLFANGERTDSFRGVAGAFGMTPEVRWSYTVYLEPIAFDELRLEIEEPADYATWVPTATLGGGAGAAIPVTARLRTKSGAEPKVSIDSFEWQLEDVSNEPGIAMNWPAEGAADMSWDLGLDADGGTFVVLEDDQKLIRAVASGHSDTVRVRPYDFGAWGRLDVVAVLADGRRVRGKLAGGTDFGLRLPKREVDSKIASVWRRENAAGDDEEDDDARPEGDGNAGDGFSNYEEYRGFVVDGAHRRTNPVQKDLFVHNLAGALAESGLRRFATVTGLTVHGRVRGSEMPGETRTMNHRRSTRSPRSSEALQHGLVLRASRDGDRPTATIATGGARPGDVPAVTIGPALFAPGSENDLTAHVCRELLHAVGVGLHGHGEKLVGWRKQERTLGAGREFWFEEVEVAGSGAGLQFAAAGTRIRIFTEQGAELPAGDDDFLRRPVPIWVARHGMEHSGDVACVLRYAIAGAFTQPGRPGDRFLCPPEPVGEGLCSSANGTGFNAPGAPIVRHGDATRGNCRASICVRDDAPVRGR